ncbi:MAG: hypothetical protein LBD06_05095 [Candidatus Accumulibacter sp.]|nr:hypothetical protein [Accumulibacter sp.]
MKRSNPIHPPAPEISSLIRSRRRKLEETEDTGRGQKFERTEDRSTWALRAG